MKSISRTTIVFGAILLAFILIRVVGLDIPYHQDESKYVESFGIYRHSFGVNSPHPPITQIFFASAADIFGYGYVRAMPFLFSIANLVLLFLYMRRRFGDGPALWSVGLFTVSFYSVLGSLMVDTDGALLPFFFLCSLYVYERWEGTSARARRVWGAAFLASLALGMLTKLSFVLVIASYGIELVRTRRLAFRAIAAWLLAMMAMGALLLWKGNLLAPSYDAAQTISHAFDHVRLGGRNYLQVLIQFAKAAMYASPLLIGTALFLPRRRLADVSVCLAFLGLGVLFYGIVFDFSSAALDKYLMFAVVPLAVIGGVAIHERLSERPLQDIPKSILAAMVVVAVAALAVAATGPFAVPPLYPKEEWIGRILALRWDFLFPFTGGSGPVGFYVSWTFIGLGWLIAAGMIAAGLLRPSWRHGALTILLTIGLAYNMLFTEEYLAGRLYGSPNRLLRQAVEHLSSSSIPSVITYNDIGGSLLRQIGKYQRRLYAAPKFEREYVATLTEFNGHYLVIDIPHLNPSSLYGRYFSACPVVYQARSGYISSAIYDCRNVSVPAL